MAKAAANEDNIVKFARPYEFEGETYTEIDLSGCANIRAKDMVKANDYLSREGRVIVAVPELDLQYLLFIAHLATGKPIEFFENLPMASANKVKNKVRSFFQDEE